jgi:hypothetical protein
VQLSGLAVGKVLEFGMWSLGIRECPIGNSNILVGQDAQLLLVAKSLALPFRKRVKHTAILEDSFTEYSGRLEGTLPDSTLIEYSA